MSHSALNNPLATRTHLIHSAMRFLRLIRHRKAVLIATSLIVALLGAFYYSTAKRIYKANASLLVLQNAAEDAGASTSEGYRQGMLPTYERLFTSTVVLEGAIKTLQEMSAETRVDLMGTPKEEWLDVLRANLSANGVRSTNIIEIGYLSAHPSAAETVVNAVVDSYLQFIDKNHKNVAAEMVTILDREQKEVADRLMAKERQLLDVKQNLGDLGLGEKTNVVHPLIQNVVRLNEQLIQVRQDRVQLESTLAAVQIAAQNGGDLRQHLITIEPTVGREVVLRAMGLSTKDNELTLEMERKLSDDQAELEKLRNFYGDAHPRIVDLQRGIERNTTYLANYNQIRNQRINDEENGKLGPMLISMVAEDLSRTRSHEQRLFAEFKRSEQQAVALNGRIAESSIIEHDIQLLREMHDSLGNRISKIDIRQNQSDVRVAVVSEAFADGEPVSPKLPVVAVLSLIAGLGLGSLIVYVTDILDDRFRSPEELKDELGAPLLAMIRQLEPTDGNGLEALQLYTAPDSVESEAFRTLRTTLAFSTQTLDCVAVSSSEPGDGKTTVLANLGVASSQAGKRTLLIDADMRRPGLSKLFEVRGLSGLGDLLRGDDPVNAAASSRIQTTGMKDLDVLPCGLRPSDPTSLLTGPRFADFLAWADSVYDQVLIDTPPILAASDAVIIGRLADGLIMVVQPEKNNRRFVHRAVEEVTLSGLNFVGVVANRITVDSRDGYYGYGYGYGHGYGNELVGETEQHDDNYDVEDLIDDVVSDSSVRTSRHRDVLAYPGDSQTDQPNGGESGAAAGKIVPRSTYTSEIVDDDAQTIRVEFGSDDGADDTPKPPRIRPRRTA